MQDKAPLSFENTEIAFGRYSNADLKRAKWLFGMFNYRFIVNYAPPVTSIALKIVLPIKGLVRRTIFNHFCGGETINDCDRTVGVLHENNIGAILDYSVEGHQNVKEFDANAREIVKTIEKAATGGAYPFAVFKPTGIGRFSIYEKVSAKIALTSEETEMYYAMKDRFNMVCKRAHELGVPLFVDAEESWIQDAIDDLVEEMMVLYNADKSLIFNTVQLYRKGRVAYISQLYEKARVQGFKVGLKLVRGAYMEKERERAEKYGYPSPIQDNKKECDADFDAAVKLCFEQRDITKLCMGTHNENSSMLLANMIDEAGLERNDDRFWFAQLYGMSDHISFNLAHAGFNVAKYLPYGPVAAVLPYLSRRASENSSVAGQAGREISLIRTELARRKSASA